jgi:peptide/nickel transport system substrate-binding protein
VATSWRYVVSNRVFQFKLRHDARFSDGGLVTAAAVKIYMEDEQKSGAFSNALNVKSISTIGKWTVRVMLSTPSPFVPFELSGPDGTVAYPTSPRAIAHPKLFSNETYGAGPYVLDPTQTVAGDHYTFVPNKFYYDKTQIRFKKVIVKVIASKASMLQALETGEIDIADGDVTTASAAAAAGFKVVHAPAAYAALLFMDLGGTIDKPLADVRVRQAMNYAINRKAIVRAIYGKYATPSSELQISDGFVRKYQNYYPYDPALAKSLLAKAGYPNGFSFDITTYQPTSSLVNGAVAQDLKQVGITMNVADPLDANLTSGKYPVWSCVGCGDQPTAEFYEVFLKPDSYIQQHNWIDPVLNNLWLKGLASAHPARYWRAIMTRIVTQAYAVPIAIIDEITYESKKFTSPGISAERRNWDILDIRPAT